MAAATVAAAATTSPTSSSPNPSWHFPFGPSSRYHQRERPTAPQHVRGKSAYTPTAPNLFTERRAGHRRRHTQSNNLSGANSPPSEYARSPLSRFSSYHHNMAASHQNAGPSTLPSTPAKLHRRSSSVRNSPYSDYFTDDARSMDSNVSSTVTKRLLVRMNKLQSQLMRDSSSSAGQEAIGIVGTKLDEIERAFATLHAQMKAPTFAVEDSGIFSDEDETGSKNAHCRHDLASSEPYLDTGMNGSTELPPEPGTIVEFRAERDWFILRTQELLDGLRFTQTELSDRFTEVRQLNEEHNVQIEERDTQIEQLRSENEGLRSDLGFEYSELLFLKLQMKSLEVDVDAIGEDVDASESAAGKATHAKKNRILSEMDRWRTDWQDVKGRFTRRRSRHGVSPERRDSLSVHGGASPSTCEAEWDLQTVKEGHGRVTSLTIKRTDSTHVNSMTEQPGTADAADPLQVSGSDLARQTQSQSHQSQSRKHNYIEHGTQTEDQDQGDKLFSPDGHEENEGEEEEGEEEEDCAITTSSEDSDVEEEEEEEEITQKGESTPSGKTAWQELWDSLQNLTGIDDRFED